MSTKINSRKIITITALTALVIAGIITVFSGCFLKQAEPVQQLAYVNYIVLSGQDITLTSELPGRTSAFMVSEVRPQVSGIIQKRLFEEGADVKAGQVLYQIDPALYQATYDSAKASLAKAKANAEAANLLAQRYQDAIKTNAVSKQDYDNAKASAGQANAEVDAAEAALETARINLEYTRVTSPISGRIGRSAVTPGALVTQNQAAPLSTVQQLDPVYVDVTQSSMEMLRLRRTIEEGQLKSSGENATKVLLLMEDGASYSRLLPDGSVELIEGELLFSDVTVEQSTGVVTIRVKFDNSDRLLLPGMYVRAVLNSGISEDAILVPQRAIMRDNRGRPMVYVLAKEPPQIQANAEQQTAVLGQDEFFVQARFVTIDRAVGNNWLIADGLHIDELVLVDGLQKVRQGQMVTGVRLPETEQRLAKPGLDSAQAS